MQVQQHYWILIYNFSESGHNITINLYVNIFFKYNTDDEKQESTVFKVREMNRLTEG